jgi:hypothetical protein
MPVSTTDMMGVFKTFYTPDQMEQLLWRNSPGVRRIQKVKVTGKEYAFPMLHGRGGAVAGNAATAVAASATTSRTAQMAAQYGNLFSAFQLTNKEAMASVNEKGAFEPVGVVKMFAAAEALRKTIPASFYGMGFGEVGRVQGAVAPAATTLLVDDATLVKIDVGSVFSVTVGPLVGSDLPSDTLLAGTFTITKIDSDGAGNNQITFTPGATAVTGFPDQAWICLDGCRDSTTPLLPMGLAGALPYWGNRTGSGWQTYIGTAFQGVDRSVAVSRLAGGFILRNVAGGETMTQAITRAVKLARRQGGEPDLIILNDNDFASIVAEMNADRNYWQAINTGDKGASNEIVVGLERMSYAQATSWVKNVIDDPYCPQGIFYVLETKVVKFVGLSNPEKAFSDGISDNEPGAPPVTKEGDVPTNQYALNIDDILTLNPLAVAMDGAGIQALLSLYGAFVVQNPAHCVVGKFA